MTLTVGTKLGRYEIRSQLGAGGMGEVYLAQDTKLDRKVALKILPQEFAEDKDRMSRFVREAKSASALNHPNIITIHEIGETKGTHFIATEYIEGETLQTLLKGQSLSLKSTLEIALQVASALDAAHRAGIVHRDIKPDNVMVRHDGIVKVLDFGLVKLSATDSSEVDPEAETKMQVTTRVGMIMGTVAYMSPEQARGQETDARTDIWSFGCVLYEMLTRQQPFQGETMTDVLANIIHREPALIIAHRENTPAEFERIIAKTVCKNKDERYQSAKELFNDLQQLQTRMLITAELIDSLHDVYLWAETYRRTMEDIFDIQEKVAAEIVQALQLRLSPDEEQILKKRFTENTGAYQLYLQGRFFWNKRSQEGLKTAIRYFEKAIEKDPQYALAWAGIADSYTLLGEYGNIPRKELYPKAEAAVNKALEIDNRLAEVHTSLASLLMLSKWDWVNSENGFKLALGLNPNYATAHHWYSQWFLSMGRLEESLRMISRAAELDPVSQAILKDQGLALYYNRQYDNAIEIARKALELDPNYAAAHRLLSLAYQGKELFDEAIAENRNWGTIT